MSLCEIDHINIVAYARSVRSVVIIAEYAKFFTDAYSCLREIWNQILRHTVGELADLCGGMCTDRIKVTEDYALERCAGIDDVCDDFLGDLLGVAVRGSCLFDGRLFGHRILVRLSIDSA